MEREESNQSSGEPVAPDLSAYFDGEVGDPDEMARFESTIREDANLREQLHEYEALRTQLRRLPKIEAPPYLRKRIAYTMSARGRRMNALRMASRFIAGSAVVAAVIAVIAATFWHRQISSVEGDPIYLAMLADHAKYRPGSADVEFFGDSPAELEGWLAARLDFSPRIPRWSWAKVQSGRACSLRGNKVAFVRYRCGGEEMSLYIWPTKRESKASESAPAVFTSEQGFEVALWSREDFIYGLVAEPGTTDLPNRIEDML